jgi:cytochrome P450
VGALPSLAGDPLGYLLSARARYGDIYTLDLGLTRAIMLNHPRHAQHVLRDNARGYGKGGPIWDSIRCIVGNGLPTSEGEFWLRQRRMLQPHFHKDRLASLMHLMVGAIDESLARWDAAAESGEPVEAYHEFARMTMNVVVKSLFGAGITPEEADAVGHEMNYAVEHILASLFTNALPKWMPVPGRKRFEKALRTIDEVVYKLINRRRESKQSGGDLLGIMLDTVDDETGKGMEDIHMRDEAVSLLIAGYETTSTALAFICGCLLERPDIVRNLQDDFDKVIGQETPNLAHLPRLPLAQMVVQESLRMYPPTYWVLRTALEDDVIDGYRIPKGTIIGVTTYAIQRHPEFWQEPEKFDPWRFTPERSAGRHPLAWIPFGIGQRLCIGRDFALMEGQLFLARWLSRFDIEPVPGRPVKAGLAATIRPQGGVWIRLRKRTPRAVAAVG